MKSPVMLLPLVVLGFLLVVSTPADENRDTGSAASPKALSSLPGSTWSFSVLNSKNFTAKDFIGTNRFLVGTNRFAPVPFSTSTNRHANDLPGPGVYRTEPFAGIVVVPGTNIDDRMIIGPLNSDEKMPILRPNLRFIPWGGKQDREHKE
jgi:hypothetical protein